LPEQNKEKLDILAVLEVCEIFAVLMEHQEDRKRKYTANIQLRNILNVLIIQFVTIYDMNDLELNS